MAYTQEVDFGRINAIRSPDSVLAAQLEDVAISLATAGCVSLDPAGRLVTSNLVDDLGVSSAIDSPLKNLAMYLQLMREGSLGDSLPLPDSWIDMAARSLGAASDKGGAVGVDLVAYLNENLGLADEAQPGMLDKTCINVRQEVTGEVRYIRKCFLDYGAYAYDREQNFMNLPDPPYIPSDAPQAGSFEYLAELSNTVPVLFEIVQGPILDAVPALWAPDPPTTNIGAFAAAADDTRAVIEFMHKWPVPGNYPTPVPCDAGATAYYDVSISGRSGLQVPVRMIAGTNGREGTVTVYNAGPAEVYGTVTVVGVDSDGMAVGPLYAVIGGTPTDVVLFEYPEPFVLPAGFSTGWTFYFSIGYPTQINWTATVQASLDVNEANNQVTEVTTVTRAKGGGNGGKSGANSSATNGGKPAEMANANGKNGNRAIQP